MKGDKLNGLELKGLEFNERPSCLPLTIDCASLLVTLSIGDRAIVVPVSCKVLSKVVVRSLVPLGLPDLLS